MLLNVAAENVSIRNIKVSKRESHTRYSVTKHTASHKTLDAHYVNITKRFVTVYFLCRCTLCDVYVSTLLRFGTLMLCEATFCNITWRLRYDALRYVATSWNEFPREFNAWIYGVWWCLASALWRFLKGYTLWELCAGGRVLACPDAWHLHMEGFCKVLVYKEMCAEGEFWRVLMPGIYVVKFFERILSMRVVCRRENSGVCWCLASTWWSSFQLFTLQEFCAGGRFLACADAWHLCGEVFCKGSLYESCMQEGEFWRVLMPGIYVVKFFSIVHSTRVLCRRESSGVCWCLASTVVKFFALVHSTRVVCRRESSGGVCWCLASTWWSFLQGFTLWELYAGGRVLACADAWHLHGGSIRWRIHATRDQLCCGWEEPHRAQHNSDTCKSWSIVISWCSKRPTIFFFIC